MRALAVLLTDALAAFKAKGEMKGRYYNPGGCFDEVHFFSPAREEIDAALARPLVGDVPAVIHPLGPAYAVSGWWTGSTLGRALRALSPAVLRAYDPGPRGALAAAWGRRLGVPSVISVHCDMDDQRRYERRLKHEVRRRRDLELG